MLQRHANEGESIAEAIRDCLDYGKNPEKTEDGKYISSYECDPATVAAEFLLAKASYKAMTGREQKKGSDVLCYQIRQSFYPGEITPEEANRISYELAMRWTKGRHAFIVTTHTDKQHIHSHIYYNSTTLDCTRKFRNFWGSSFALLSMNFENNASVNGKELKSTTIQRSPTLSKIAVTVSLILPWSASFFANKKKAKSHGIPIKSFCLQPAARLARDTPSPWHRCHR